MTRNSNQYVLVNIAGYGRSGSTLLERMLGQIPDMVSVGEITHLWDRGLIDNQLCGCKSPFQNCEFWKEVVADAFGSLNDSEARHICDLRNRVAKNKHILPLIFQPFKTRAYAEALKEYQGYLGQLYTSIQRISGARYIIDSSKDPAHSMVLSQIRVLDFRLIHLVRDGRAVAHSWKRQKIRPEVHWRTEYMPQFSAGRSAIVWAIRNLLVEFLMRKARKAARIRYEDFVHEPRSSLMNLLDQLGCPFQDGDFDFIHENVVDFHINHTVAGNPMRFSVGEVQLSLDEEWKSEISSLNKMLITLTAYLLLKRYGYC